MKMKKVLSVLLVCVMLLSCLVACDNTPDPTEPENVPVTNIQLDTTAMALRVGQTGNVNATVNMKATNKNLNWTSSDEAVATVAAGESSAQAVITAVAPGTATITATAADGSGVTAAVEVTVAAAQEVVMVVPQDGEHPEPTEEITAELVFNSDGTCSINAFYAGLNAQMKYETTYEVVDGVLKFAEGSVPVVVFGFEGAIATNVEVKGDIITVWCDEVGLGNGRCAEFTLTAEQIAQFGLKTSDAVGVQKVTIGSGEMTVNSGAVFDISTMVTVEPADATVKDITVTVDESNATSQVVYMEGMNVYPLKAGTVTITVTSVDNPNASATLTLTVNAVERPDTLATNYFETAKTFAWALNAYVLNTDGTMQVLDKAGALQVLGFYTLSEDGSQLTLLQLNDLATDPNHPGSTFTLTTQADTGLLQFDVLEAVMPGVYIAVEQPAA